MGIARVIITVVDELLRERFHVYEKPETCIVGRAIDCDIQLPTDGVHREVSRHHCLLDVNPPEVHLWDLSSTNGTFVNGVRIGQRDNRANPADTEPNEERSPGIDVCDGDEIRVGNATLLVGIEVAGEVAQPVHSRTAR